ncbi:MAG: MBL fold metallo-hydrolase [Bacteroidia bacterium]|nr:MBL fold metallo-hydrolase [Bacteroidia bacterium]
MIILATLILGFIVGVLILGFILSGPKYTGSVTDHFDGKKFINPTGIKAKDLGDVLKWMLKRKHGPWKEKKEIPFGDKPISTSDKLRITYVNHSTFLIQIKGMNILTDPVWSERTSPFTFAGPKRMRPPGIRFEDLPKIDVVLLSHNHYDHLDLPVMKKIFDIHNPKIVTPLGLKTFLEQNNISGHGDLDWWDEVILNDSLKVQAMPAQHFSGRGMYDRDATLWCGYLIKSSEGNIYFAGDTGYNEKTFKEIGERCTPIAVALVPIGAYKPQWFMSPIHCSPEEAVKIHQEVKAKISIADHYGTFPLADDGDEDPKEELVKALEKFNVSKEQFLLLKEGQPMMF